LTSLTTVAATTGAFEYAKFVAGASLQCAEEIKTGRTRVAINWDGGM
jgi:acetoin utilization deacetylase AcuC-like enzyme